MLDLKENPKLDLASSNEISTQKISVPDHISGFQYTADKPDSFVIDMDSFSHGGLNKEINQNPRITAVIRRLLLSTLDDPNRKLCTAISMAVGAIAVYDWPESWPDLLPFLLKLIGDQTSMKEGVEKERGCNSTR
ncbi:hypothetical protein ES319_A11G261900v1 [Gossypium barbadense]|uniref:Importin N-terminal domain-containing protein n=2 Tax=Gossypium TaxID=3633 RepID=A0A5J5TVN9_GOSBA|nr:hypothetical protein ES319_A11G261900v1 [Gossypium barbadense]KAB2058835.1 hypothetical protein ES319_A11G261900v1 [Gossypium barbadense]TYG95657.1 hypothetical protein ES288_A11G286200v1 [Gossypium darwinii]